MDSKVGILVKHSEFGVGKVLAVDALPNGNMQIAFVGSSGVITFESRSLGQKVRRAYLSSGTRCNSAKGDCLIVRISQTFDNQRAALYEVSYPDSGVSEIVSEVMLLPAHMAPLSEPEMQLAALEHDGYPLFHEREMLAEALRRTVRGGNGLRALLASRIDLHPHQAYVAGVVLLDLEWRYILADEVGLGKTVEAGIVLRDLLVQKTDARVLILCPGTLVQQWLAELYSKFGDASFKLVDLHDESQAVSSSGLTSAHSDALIGRAIISTGLALQLGHHLAQTTWDMVIVDEAHHLLGSAGLYQLAQALSRNSQSLLLLSAIPAQHREDEFRRLLALLEPGRYTNMPGPLFRQMYDQQREIGRKIRAVTRRLTLLASGDTSAADVVDRAKDFLSMPALQHDPNIARLLSELETVSGTGDVLNRGRNLLQYVADNYRINRRILRNRRQHLIDEGLIESIPRRPAMHGYIPDQLEVNAASAMQLLLQPMLIAAGDSPEVPVILAIARLCFQSLAWPAAALQLLRSLQNAAGAPGGALDFYDHETVEAGHLAGYDNWQRYVDLLCRGACRLVDAARLQHAVEAVSAWESDSAGNTRLHRLHDLLSQRQSSKPVPKQLVFAGYPGLAQKLVAQLREKYGEDAVAAFHHGLSREEKETQVTAFRRSRSTWILVCDESGGEGRNFQFASNLIHYDTPWHVGRVEQRIGRLDRIGRDRELHPEVVSDVIFNQWSPEGGLVCCYDRGLNVYSRSISGLEFALRDVERELATKAIQGASDALVAWAPALAEKAESERARDESDALFDAASFERTVADQYWKVAQSEKTEEELESAFTRYFEHLAKGAARSVYDPDFPDQLWRFSPDSLRHVTLAIPKDPTTDRLPEFTGTFRRRVAQAKPNCDFFSVGNVLFDAVVESMNRDVVGRTFAIECLSTELPAWTGFELNFYAAPDLKAVGDKPGLVNRARQSFQSRGESIYCRCDGTIESPETTRLLSATRRALRKEDKDRLWWNLTKENAAALPAAVPNGQWETAVLGLITPAKEAARKLLSARIQSDLDAEQARLVESARIVLQAVDTDAEARRQAVDLGRLGEAIRNWQVTLDSIGFLSINGALRTTKRPARAGRAR
jgi:ATP-dependent helicase HepA